jgi:hypothetical protein
MPHVVAREARKEGALFLEGTVQPCPHSTPGRRISRLRAPFPRAFNSSAAQLSRSQRRDFPYPVRHVNPRVFI